MDRRPRRVRCGKGDKGYTVSLSQPVLFCKYSSDLFRIFRADGQGVREIKRAAPSRLRPRCRADHDSKRAGPKEPAAGLAGRAGVGKRRGCPAALLLPPSRSGISASATILQDAAVLQPPPPKRWCRPNWEERIAALPWWQPARSAASRKRWIRQAGLRYLQSASWFRSLRAMGFRILPDRRFPTR